MPSWVLLSIPRPSAPHYTVNTVNPRQIEDSTVFNVASASDKCSVFSTVKVQSQWRNGQVHEDMSGLRGGQPVSPAPGLLAPQALSAPPFPFHSRTGHQRYQKGKLDFIIKLATKSPQHHEVATWASPGSLAAG